MASEGAERSNSQRPEDDSHYRQVFRSFTTGGNARLHVGNSYVQYDVRIPFAFYAALTIGLSLLLAANASTLKSLAGAVAGFRTGSKTNQAPFMVPFSRDVGYVPRPNITDQLKIGEGQYDHQRTALYGMGGVGKTQLAVEYAHEFHARNPGIAVFWLYASTFERFQDEYRKVGRVLGISTGTGGDHTASVGEIDGIRDHLSDYRNGKWLMIIDNLDVSWDDAERSPLDFVPRTRGCRAIITTRDRNVARVFTGDASARATIPVDTLSAEEAQQLVIAGLRAELINIDALGSLTDRLGNLPLALSQAVAYMNHFDTNLDRYITTIEAEPTLFLELHAPGARSIEDSEYSHSMYASFGITFEKITWRHPDATRLLKLMACFDSQSVPETLLRAYTFADEKLFTESMGVLLALSLVSRDSQEREYGYTSGWYGAKRRTGIGISFTMHRLVHMAIRKNLVESASANRQVPGSVQSDGGGTGEANEAEDFMANATITLTKAWHSTDNELAINRTILNLNAHAHRVLVEPLVEKDSFERALLWYFLEMYLEYERPFRHRPGTAWTQDGLDFATFVGSSAEDESRAWWSSIGPTLTSSHALQEASHILQRSTGEDEKRDRQLRWCIALGRAAPDGSVPKSAPDEGLRVLFSATLNTSVQWEIIMDPMLRCIASVLEVHLNGHDLPEHHWRWSPGTIWVSDVYQIYLGVSCDGVWAAIPGTGDPTQFTRSMLSHISAMLPGCSNTIVDVAAWYEPWLPNFAFSFTAEALVAEVRRACGTNVGLSTTITVASGFPPLPMCGRSDDPRLGDQPREQRDMDFPGFAVYRRRHWLARMMDFVAAPWTFLLFGWSEVSGGSWLFDLEEDEEQE